MILETLIPIYAAVLLGNLLKRWNFLNDVFINSANKILETYLLPGFIFWTVAQTTGQYGANWKLFVVFTIAGFIVYLLIHLYIILFKIPLPDAVLLSQSCYRFNAYVGLALVQGFDKLILRDLCIFIGFGLPVIDIITILTFSRLSPKTSRINLNMRMILHEIASRPLLPACLIGIIFSTANFHWPLFFINLFQIIIPVTVPFALIVIGGSLSFKFLKKPLRLPVIGSIFKFILLPVIGYFLINLFALDTVTTKVIMIFFMVPCKINLPLEPSVDYNQPSAYHTLSTILSFIFITIVVIIF